MGTVVISILSILSFLSALGIGYLYMKKIKQDSKKVEPQVIQVDKEKETYKLNRIIDLQTKAFKLETTEIKAENLNLAEQYMNQVDQMLRSHYLNLIRHKTEGLRKKIKDFINEIESNGEDVKLKDFITREEADYLSMMIQEKHIDEQIHDEKRKSIKDLYIQILKLASESLDNYIQLPDYLIYKKLITDIFSIIKKDLSVRIQKNGFDLKPPDEWKDYLDKTTRALETIFTSNLDQLYWHRSIIKRIELYNHNMEILPSIKETIIDLFNEMRQKTIEINKQVKDIRDEITNLS